MTIRELLRLVNTSDEIRIRIIGVGEITGRVGSYGTIEIMEKLRRKNCEHAWVTCICPLHHARELYIECVAVVE